MVVFPVARPLELVLLPAPVPLVLGRDVGSVLAVETLAACNARIVSVSNTERQMVWLQHILAA